MIQAAGITLRETVEAILVVSIILAYLSRTGRINLKKYVYLGAFAAVGASILFAAALSAVGINPENEVLEGTMLITAGVFVATLVVWMWRASKTIKQDIERQVEKVVRRKSTFAFASALGIALVAFLVVFREGAETVIFLQSLALSGVNPVSNVLGGIIGISLALVFGIVFLRGVARINLSRFFKITSAILAVLVFSLILRGFHEFIEVGLLPSNDAVLSFVGFFARESTSALLIAGMISALIIVVIYDTFKARPPLVKGLSGAERRKKMYEFSKERYIKVGVGITLIIVVFVLMAPAIIAQSSYVNPEPEKVTAEDQLITLDTLNMENGFYKYYHEENGKKYEFLMVVHEGKPYLGLDDCYICPPAGYGFSKEEKVLFCFNCEAPIEIESVGIPGGCNPVIFPFTDENGIVRINTNDLILAGG